jgi:hypothetical protein
VIVVDRDQGTSSLPRVNQHELETWLGDYSLGELWRETFTMIRVNVFVEGQTEETFVRELLYCIESILEERDLPG